ncbi:diguanylate cyclase domain-containing protein [Planococcus citreus]|uniref:Diguanylate cyclase (GGDEF)-like protein n=1 Tax=Planococcus citreus TaxID=1373 RepID=A0A497YX37_9BACL|nr:diguanylate cyclase [Planococcus citreus]RLJ91394.1 diguanylate cyclase (GGDEF)-like protein [Planococcus citreus]
MKSLSLRNYWGLIFAVFILLFAAVLSVLVSEVSTKRLEEERGNALSSAAFQMKDRLDQYMWGRYSEIKTFGEIEELALTTSIEEKRATLEMLQDQVPAFSWIGITDSAGVVTASTNELLEGMDLSDRPVYSEARQADYVGDVHEALLLADLLPNPGGHELEFVDISVPFFYSDGSFGGVVAAHLSWDWAQEVMQFVLRPLNRSENELEVFVLSPGDNRVILGPEQFLGKPLPIDSYTLSQGKRAGWVLEQWPDGNSYLTGFTGGRTNWEYPGLEWTVLVRQPEETAFAAARDLSRIIMLSGLASAVLFALAGWLVAGRISRPLNEISNKAKAFRKGSQLVLPKNTGVREIEDLSNSLESLVMTLGTTESDLVRMQDLAQRDPLTGLPNRIALEEAADRMMKQARTTDGKLAFFYLDLDGFKKANDSLGHLAGDHVLQKVAERLTAELPEEAFISRIGGDEFVLLFPCGGLGESSTRKLAQRLIDRLSKPITVEAGRVQLGCSIGIAIYPDNAENLYTLLSYADAALYVSKENGKSQTTFYRDIASE